MTTTVETISGGQAHVHRRGLALVIAATLAVGGAVAATAAIAANDNDTPQTHVEHQSVPFAEQPMLRIGGPR